MPFVPIEQAIADNGWKTLRLIATDMDGTHSAGGKVYCNFTPRP